MPPDRATLRAFLDSPLVSSDEREALQHIMREVERANLSACVVGGAVRDWLTDATVTDIDIVVEGDAIGLADSLAATAGGGVTRHPKFGTATWEFRDLLLDIATARTESYATPGALPAITPASLLDDFARRDFTINAMALRLGERWLDADDALLDPFAGRADLAAGVVRALHAKSFDDDPTRTLRAARYAARYGFALDPSTRTWLNAGLPHLARVSGERIRYDLELIFGEARPADALAMLRDWGAFHALGIVAPTAEQLRARYDAATRRTSSGEWPFETLDAARESEMSVVGWGALVYDMGQHSAARWLKLIPFRHEMREALNDIGPLSALSARLFAPPRKASQQHALLATFSGLALFVGWLFDGDAHKREAFRREWRTWRATRPTTTGDDIKALGVPPGKVFQMLLGRLRDARLDGDVQSSDQEAALLKELIAELTHSQPSP